MDTKTSTMLPLFALFIIVFTYTFVRTLVFILKYREHLVRIDLGYVPMIDRFKPWKMLREYEALIDKYLDDNPQINATLLKQAFKKEKRITTKCFFILVALLIVIGVIEKM